MGMSSQRSEPTARNSGHGFTRWMTDYNTAHIWNAVMDDCNKQ